jgi:type IV fimbrial biogenesis protein FimT
MDGRPTTWKPSEEDDMDVAAPLRRHMAGVTLVEALTTSTIALTLTAIAVPAMRNFNTVQETAVAANTIVGDLALARHAAVTGRQAIVLCPSSDGSRCTGGFDWSDGWLVFADDDGDRQLDAEEQRLRVASRPANQVRILTSSGRHKVVYRSDGTAAGTNATFRICNARDPDRRRAVIISGTGRARLSRRDASDREINCE